MYGTVSCSLYFSQRPAQYAVSSGEIDVVSGPEYGYRNRSQFQMVEGRIGYFEEGTHDLVPIKETRSPDADAATLYRRQRAIFDGLYEPLEPTFRALHRLQAEQAAAISHK